MVSENNNSSIKGSQYLPRTSYSEVVGRILCDPVGVIWPTLIMYLATVVSFLLINNLPPIV
jgi:hypothetical protein